MLTLSSLADSLGVTARAEVDLPASADALAHALCAPSLSQQKLPHTATASTQHLPISCQCSLLPATEYAR